jgi:hypothetical protein
VTEEGRQGRPADQPLSEVGVPVDIRAAGHLGVVEVDAVEAVQPDVRLDPGHYPFSPLEGPVSSAGGEQVLSVEADPKSRIVGGGGDHGTELAEAAPASATGAGGILEQDRAARRGEGALNGVERPDELGAELLDDSGEADPPMAAQVEHEAGGAEAGGNPQVLAQAPL